MTAKCRWVARRHFAARLRLVAACWRGRKSKAWTITTEDAEKGRRTRRVGDDAEIGHGGDSKLKTTAAQLKLAATDASTSWRTWPGGSGVFLLTATGGGGSALQ